MRPSTRFKVVVVGSPVEPDPVAPMDPALRSRLGFDGDAWLSLAREASSPGPTPDELGTLGAYRLLAEAGRGSQGVVYKAVQPGTGRVVALKKLWAGSLADRVARARFEREIEAVAALSHPGVVPLYGAETTGQHPIIVMEWVDGQSLAAWGEGAGLRARLVAFAAICDAVAHAHQRGVIHRDLKPANIMIHRDGTPRVMDFGLAKLDRPGTGVSATLATSFVGTPAYASPEQIGAGVIDTRSDAYSLGVILYELVAGRLPFSPGAPLPELFDQIRHREAVRPSLATPERKIPRDLDAIVLQAMAKDPARRYQSVEALAADVRRYLDGHGVLAHPPSIVYEAGKFVRRHRVACALGALGVGAIGALAVVSTIQATRLSIQDAALTTSLGAERELRRVADARADEAAQSKTKADQERDYSKASAEFMQDLLASLGEALQSGDAAPARATLEDAVARLETRGAYEAPVEIRLRRQLAILLRKVDARERSKDQLDRAWALCQEVYPREHEETARTLLLLGFAAESDRDLERAEALYRESADLFERTLGPDHPETAHALNNLGCALKDLHRFDEAEGTHKRALAIRVAHFGEVGREVAMSLRNLGTNALGAGRIDEAEAYYERALAACAAGHSTREDAYGIRFNIGRVRLAQKRFADAEAIFAALVEEGIAMGGEATHRVGRSLGFLSRALSHQGKAREAMLAAERHLASYEAFLPERHPERVDAMVVVGLRRIDAGEPARAEDMLRRAIEAALDPIQPPRVRDATRHLVRALQALGREGDALAAKAREREILDRARLASPSAP